MPVPWEALLLSIGICVVLPLVAAYFSRKWIIGAEGTTELDPGRDVNIGDSLNSNRTEL